MFKKLRDYFTEKKEARQTKKELRQTKDTMEILMLNKFSELLDKEIENKELEKEVLDTIKQQNSSFTPEETRNFMNSLDNFMDGMKNPKISNAFFEKIQANAHEEKMAELAK